MYPTNLYCCTKATRSHATRRPFYPIDIDLVVPDAVESLLLDYAKELGFHPINDRHLDSFQSLHAEMQTIEIHDFQKYSDELFLLEHPESGAAGVT